MTHDLLTLTTTYLEALEANDEADIFARFHADMQQIEWPNRLTPKGTHRNLAHLKASFAKGMAMIDSQRYEVTKLIASGDTVAFEAVWTAVMKVPVGTLKPGDTMKAWIASFLTYQDGLIVSQRSYDCFEAF